MLWIQEGLGWGCPDEGPVQPLAEFCSPVPLSYCVCVPGSTLLKSALAGPGAGFSGLFPKLVDAYGVGSWLTAELKCLLGLPCSFLNMMQWE